MKNHIVSARQLPLPNQVARYLARLGRKHMQTTSRAWLLLLAFSFAITSLSAIAQVVTATVPVEGDPAGIEVIERVLVPPVQVRHSWLLGLCRPPGVVQRVALNQRHESI